MFHDLFAWVQETLGANPEGYPPSWSQQFLGSLNLWSLTEGTHVLTLMLFAGTIWIVDLRMMGVAFREVPFSKLNDRVLPFTILGFALMIVTGIVLFLAKPMDYYHNIWFRAKMVFLLLAAANIYWFHHKLQKSQDEWDTAPAIDATATAPRDTPFLFTAGSLGLLFLSLISVAAMNNQVFWIGVLVAGAIVFGIMEYAPAFTSSPGEAGWRRWVGRLAIGLAIVAYLPIFLPSLTMTGGPWVIIFIVLAIASLVSAFYLHHARHPNPPLNVKLSAVISMTSWIIIIVFGRFIAYNWFECGKPLPAFFNVTQECGSTYSGAIPLEPDIEAMLETDGATFASAQSEGE